MESRTWRVVGRHQLSHPPRTLWRVAHHDNHDAVFSSRAYAEFYNDHDFFDLLDHHFDWHNKQPTPFISTFASQRHALNWAAQRIHERDDHCVRLYEIYSDGLFVFRGASDDEFLVLDEIPNENIGFHICGGCLWKERSQRRR